jgi:hypothetical protein
LESDFSRIGFPHSIDLDYIYTHEEVKEKRGKIPDGELSRRGAKEPCRGKKIKVEKLG